MENAFYVYLKMSTKSEQKIGCISGHSRTQSFTERNIYLAFTQKNLMTIHLGAPEIVLLYCPQTKSFISAKFCM